MTLIRLLLLPACLTALALPGLADENPAEKPVEKPKINEANNQEKLEKDFSEKLSGSALVGVFTVTGKESDKAPQPERYELQSVTKLQGNKWLFLARIGYGNKKQSIPIPVTVDVLWAGDTPMISLTDLTIPAMGTFSARVLFHGDRYAGTWQHGPAGGHMYGTIEKSAPAKEEKTEEKTE